MKIKTMLLVVTLLLHGTATFSLFGGKPKSKTGIGRRASRRAARAAAQASEPESQTIETEDQTKQKEHESAREEVDEAVKAAEAKADVSKENHQETTTWTFRLFSAPNKDQTVDPKEVFKKAAQVAAEKHTANDDGSLSYNQQAQIDALDKPIDDELRNKGHKDVYQRIKFAKRSAARADLLKSIQEINQPQRSLTKTGIYVGYEGQEDPSMESIVYTQRKTPGVVPDKYELSLTERVARRTLDNPQTLIAKLSEGRIDDKYQQSLSGRVSSATLALVKAINHNMDMAQGASYSDYLYYARQNRSLFKQLNQLAQLAQIRGLAIEQTEAVNECAKRHHTFIAETKKIAEQEADQADIKLELAWNTPVETLLQRLQTISREKLHSKEKDANIQAVISAINALIEQMETDFATTEQLETAANLVQTVFQKSVHVDPAIMERLQNAIAKQTTALNQQYKEQSKEALHRRLAVEKLLLWGSVYEQSEYGRSLPSLSSETDALNKADEVVLGTHE